MSKLKELLQNWESREKQKHGVKRLQLDLPLQVAAKIMALSNMYPGRTNEQIVYDLLIASLYDLEEIMPYIKGHKEIMEDEYGDPVYEDIGLGPQFQAVTSEYLQQLKRSEN